MVGVDLVKISRFSSMLSRVQRASSSLLRIYSERELAHIFSCHCVGSVKSLSAGDNVGSESLCDSCSSQLKKDLATIFAAKEATYKFINNLALHHGALELLGKNFGFLSSARYFEYRKTSFGQPYVVLDLSSISLLFNLSVVDELRVHSCVDRTYLAGDHKLFWSFRLFDRPQSTSSVQQNRRVVRTFSLPNILPISVSHDSDLVVVVVSSIDFFRDF